MSDPLGALVAERARQRQKKADPLADLVAQRAKEIGYGEAKESGGIVGGIKQVASGLTHPVETVKGMAHSIAEGLNQVSSPVVGMPTNLLHIPGKPSGRITKENTPNAVTPGKFARGAFDTGINIGFALAPELGIPARLASNATLGALHDPEDRVRGATSGLLFGEVLHGATKAPGKIAGKLRSAGDVSEGVMQSGAEGVAEANAEQRLWSPKRRPKETLPINQRQPVEPKPDAETYSTKGRIVRRPAVDPLSEAVAKRAAERSAQPEQEPAVPALTVVRGGVSRLGKSAPVPGKVPGTDISSLVENMSESMGELLPTDKPRPALTQDDYRREAEVPVEYNGEKFWLARSHELGEDGRWESFSTTRPRTESQPSVRTESETAHFPLERDIAPVAASNGAFEARPGVLRQVNRELKKAPESTVTLPRITPEEIPDTTPRITVEESNKRINAAIEAEKARQEKLKIRRSKWAPGESIRDEAGALRKDLTNVPDEVLEAEVQRIHELNASEEAAAAAVKEAHYRDAYNELPRTERLGRKGQEDLPDADGMVDAERLAEDNKTLSDYNRNTIVRQARARALERLEAELASRKPEKYRRIEDEPPEEEFDDSFDFGANVSAERPSELLNVAKLNLLDKTAEQRIVEQLEQHRALREDNKQTFAEADVNRAAIVQELVGGDIKALSPAKAKRLSGEELLARRDVVSRNDALISELSKAIESQNLPVNEHQRAVELLQRAIEHNDALLADLVTGSSQKGRDLNLLRRIANRDLDPATWLIQAKRMLGDKPLTDEVAASIRKLSQEAMEACK